MAVNGREVLRWLSGNHVMETGRGQFEALLMEIAEPAEEWLTSAQAMSLARRTGTDRVMPWEQMGQAGVAARYAERSPAQLPPAARARRADLPAPRRPGHLPRRAGRRAAANRPAGLSRGDGPRCSRRTPDPRGTGDRGGTATAAAHRERDRAALQQWLAMPSVSADRRRAGEVVRRRGGWPTTCAGPGDGAAVPTGPGATS